MSRAPYLRAYNPLMGYTHLEAQVFDLGDSCLAPLKTTGDPPQARCAQSLLGSFPKTPGSFQSERFCRIFLRTLRLEPL